MMNFARNNKRSLIRVPAQHGKMQDPSTPVPTPSGWTTIGSLAPGDWVYGSDGRLCRVLATRRWAGRKRYLVRSDSGEEIIAGAEHEWLLQLDLRGPWKFYDTETLAHHRSHRARTPIAAPLEGLDSYLPVPPYVLGFWLGDGDSNAVIHKWEPDIPFVRAQFEAEGVTTTERRGPQQFGTKGLRARLRLAGVWHDKHIPAYYLRASYPQRLALLQGLIDSDGYVAKDGQVEFCSTNRRLAEDVLELVRTMGTKARIINGHAMLNGRDYGPKYRVMFYLDNAARLPRKAVNCRSAAKKPFHYLEAEFLDVGDGVCIEVDSPDHMFLSGRTFLPSHNSSLMSKVFPTWEIVCNPNVRIILIMKTERDAFSYSDLIRQKLADESDKLVKDFGPFVPKGSQWAQAQFNVAGRQIKDPHFTMEFYGAGGPVLGHRCDIVIVDDVVTDETAGTIGRRESQLKWFREQVQTGPRYMWPISEFDPKEVRDQVVAGDPLMTHWARHNMGLTPEGMVRLLKVPLDIDWPDDIHYERIVVCGTTFHPKDLYFELDKDKTYKSLYFDCYTHDPKTGALGALWPAQMPLDKLEAEKESSGVLSFNKRFRNIALDEGELVFKEAMVMGGEYENVEYEGILDRERSWGEFDESWFRTLGHDPASGSTSRYSTWPSYIVLGLDEQDPRRKMYMIDLFRRQMGVEDIISVLLDGVPARGLPGFHKLYRYQRGLIETNACQRWLLQHHRVKEAMERGVNLEPHHTGGNKWDEVMGMSSIVRYVQNSLYSIPYATPADQAKAQPLIEQLLQFPKGIFDYVMALWFATLAAESMMTQFESFYIGGHSGRMVANPIFLAEEDGQESAGEEVYMSDRRKRLLGLL